MMSFGPDELRRDGTGTVVLRVPVMMLPLFMEPTMGHVGPRECQPHNQGQAERR